MSDLKVIYTQNPKCLVRVVGDGVIIMPPEGEVTHSLGDLECFIWGQFNGTNDLNAVLSAILDHYDVQEDVAQADLLTFTSQLLSMDLIH